MMPAGVLLGPQQASFELAVSLGRNLHAKQSGRVDARPKGHMLYSGQDGP